MLYSRIVHRYKILNRKCLRLYDMVWLLFFVAVADFYYIVVTCMSCPYYYIPTITPCLSHPLQYYYSGVPNKRVDRLICRKPFSHRRQTYLEHISIISLSGAIPKYNTTTISHLGFLNKECCVANIKLALMLLLLSQRK